MTKELGLSREQLLEMQITKLENELGEVRELLNEVSEDLDKAVTKIIRIIATGKLSAENIQKIAEVMDMLYTIRERVLGFLK